MKSTPRKTVYIADLKEGQQLHDLFLVSKKNLAETKSGNPYLALTLMDRTGEIEARAWDNAARLDAVAEVGRIVAVEGQVKAFRDQLQLNITGLQPVAEGSVDLAHFMPASRRGISEMQAELAGRKLIMVLLDSAGQYSRIADAERLRHWLTGDVNPATFVLPSS